MQADAELERPSKIRKLGTDLDVATHNQADPLSDQGTFGDEPGNQSLKAAAETSATTKRDVVTPTTEGTGTANIEISRGLDDARVRQSGENIEEGPTAPPLSKNQLKKQRRREEWEAGREHRKILRKEKEKARKEKKREERREAAATDGGLANQAEARVGAKPWRKAVQLPITFIIDCSWDDLMMEKEIVSLGNQLTRCYSDNHKARFRAHLAISSFGGRLMDRFDKVLENQYKGWKGVRFLSDDFVSVSEQANEWMAPEVRGGQLQAQFAKFEGQDEQARSQGEVIYLSSDAEETLTELKPYSTYIIGGLVDKNRHKAICHKRAGERNIRTAKLPISDYMQMTSRYVLAVNHVNEIMLRWLEMGDWGQAFTAVMPKRKGGVLRIQTTGDAADGGEQEADTEARDSVSSTSKADHATERDRSSEEPEEKSE